MAFHDDLSEKVYELVQVAWVGVAYADDRGAIPAFFEVPSCDPDQVWAAYEPFFNTANPVHGDPVPEQLADAAEQLYEAQFKHFEGIAISLEEWSGSAAMAFKSRLEDLWWSTAKQQRTIEEVSTLYKGYQELIKGTRSDILTIADATIAALKGYREAQERQERATNMVAAAMVISVVATVATAGIALPATAAGTAATIALTTTAVKLTETIIKGTVELNAARRVEGDNPDEIVSSMFRRIEDLLEDTRAQAEAFIAGFQEAATVLLDVDLVLPPPAEAYAPFNPEEFRVPSDIMPDSVAAAASHDPLLTGKQQAPKP